MKKERLKLKLLKIGLIVFIALFLFLQFPSLLGTNGFEKLNSGTLSNMITFLQPKNLLKKITPTVKQDIETKFVSSPTPASTTFSQTPGVYVEETRSSAPPIEGVDTDIAAFIGITQTRPAENKPVLITSYSEYTEHFGGALPENYGQYRFLPYAVQSFFSNGGSRCYIISIIPDDWNAIVPEDFLGRDPNSGINSLEALEDVGIVAVPGVLDRIIQSHLIAHCKNMKNRFAILDMPETVESQYELRDYRDQFDSPYCAMYHPWLQIASPSGDGTLYIPPSGAVAGIYSWTDSSYGVNKAPVNKSITGITGLKYTLTENDQDWFYNYGINLIRNSPGLGYRLCSMRTCSSDEEYKYVNVKRYLMYLEESIKKGTEWIKFETYNENLRSEVCQSIENFLTNEWRNGRLMGNEARHAFFVEMGITTMTNHDLEEGTKVIQVGAALLKPAEFSIIHIVHISEETD